MTRAAWGAYWQEARADSCLPGAPPAVASALEAGWQAFALTLPAGAEVLDLGTGAGAVPRAMLGVRPDLRITGIDSAPLPEGGPGFVRMGGVAAEALPFAAGAFAAITSQFGVEYAPPAALAEAARVLAPGGRLRFVVHHRGSRALAHNRARLAAMAAMREAGLFRLARMATIGAGDRAVSAAVEASLSAHAGQAIVHELPAALAGALRAPRPLEAIGAIEAAAADEMDRLASMMRAARDAEGAADMARALGHAGLPAQVAVLEAAGEGSLAFVITAG